MTLDESIQGMRLQVIRRAMQIGVSAACAEAGIFRTLFYRWQHRLSRHGVDGLHPRRLRLAPGGHPAREPRAARGPFRPVAGRCRGAAPDLSLAPRVSTPPSVSD